MSYGLTKFGMVVAALMAAVSTGEATLPVAATTPAVKTGDPRELSILSYNVEGLPWPITSGREAAAGSIADRLADMRVHGTQPHIVAVQEAFGETGKAIGYRAGYRYAAFGPAADAASTAPATVSDRAFAASASMMIGETLGKYADSGLAVFSDYPIRWTKRIAFPDYACAGLDCLANKGMLVVALDVPGSSRPVIVVDTHLNSRSASLASDTRSFYAFSRQVDTLGQLVGTLDKRDAANVLLAGDFNVGRAKPRTAYMDRALIAPEGLALAAVEHDCGHDCRRIDDAAATAKASLKKAKSIVAYTTGGSLTPIGTTIGFGRLPDGTMLSDHIGIEHRFRIG